MRFHGKLLAFLAAWSATVGVAFFLPNLEVFAADCETCMECEMFWTAGVYYDGEVYFVQSYADPNRVVSRFFRTFFSRQPRVWPAGR